MYLDFVSVQHSAGEIFARLDGASGAAGANVRKRHQLADLVGAVPPLGLARVAVPELPVAVLPPALDLVVVRGTDRVHNHGARVVVTCAALHMFHELCVRKATVTAHVWSSPARRYICVTSYVLGKPQSRRTCGGHLRGVTYVSRAMC
eukprot:3321603-Pyramimonas_sp.AAC.3